MNESTRIVLKVESEEAWMITSVLLTRAMQAQQAGNAADFKTFHELAEKLRHQLEFQQK